jgi:hypothetical protein
VLVELPAAVFDLDPLRGWCNEGPTGVAGERILAALTITAAAHSVDGDSHSLDSVIATAVEDAIAHSDLDHEFDADDPDGHFDTTGIARELRAEGSVRRQLEALTPHPDVAGALDALRTAGVRVVAIALLGIERTERLLTAAGLSGLVELLAPGPADSLEAVLSAAADQLGAPRERIAVVAGTAPMARAAMTVGLGTVWADRHKHIRGSAYRDGVSTSYRWTEGPLVPGFADDLEAAVRVLLDLAP